MEFSLSKQDYAYETLKDRILSGAYRYLHRFPPEPELADALKISRGTLRPALKRLESEGYVSGIRKNGTFVVYRRGGAERGRIVYLIEPNAGVESPSSYILPGVIDKARELDHELVFCETDFFFSDLEDSSAVAAKFAGAAGMIFCPYATVFTGEVIERLDAAGVPVALYGDCGGGGMLSVRTDYKAAWNDAIAYLSARGHTRIASIMGRDLQARGLSSLEEHKQLLLANGASPDDNLIRVAPYDKAQVKNAVKDIIAACGGVLPDVFLCFSDFYAIHVYEALRELKINIPDDVSVMGFCGYPGSAFLSPPLTTVDIDYFAKGAAIVELLLDQGKGRTGNSIFVKHKIVLRGSVCTRKNCLAAG